MKQKFEVIKITDNKMTLKANHEGGCNTCEASDGCGTGILASYFNYHSNFDKPLQKGVIVGDFIELEISSKQLFSRAFMLYIFPLLSLFTGAIIGLKFFPANELWQITFAFFGFLLSFILIKFFLKHGVFWDN